MATPVRDKNREARALATANIYGDAQALEITGIAKRTLQEYRKRLEIDSELAHLYDRCREELIHKGWVLELNSALSESFKRIKTELGNAKVETAEDLQTLIDVSRSLLEFELSRKYTEADTRDTADDQGEGAYERGGLQTAQSSSADGLPN